MPSTINTIHTGDNKTAGPGPGCLVLNSPARSSGVVGAGVRHRAEGRIQEESIGSVLRVQRVSESVVVAGDVEGHI